MIGPFRRDYFWLSNMYENPIEISGQTFTCAEAAFQAHKVERSPYAEWGEGFTGINGYEARKLGRKVRLCKDWEDIKDDVMHFVVKEKFIQHPGLRKLLFDTGNEELVEINSWGDTYWGVCNGEGENRLGKILMRVREELRECYKED